MSLLPTAELAKLIEPMSQEKQKIVKPLRILLIEDHEDTVAVLRMLLTRDGHQVASAYTLREAGKLCESEHFDLIITDLQLPDGYAYELLDSGKVCHGIKAIAVSGHGMQEHIARSRQSGFVAHLVKPIHFDELRSAVALASA